MKGNGPIVADAGPPFAKWRTYGGLIVDHQYLKATDRRWPTLGRLLLKWQTESGPPVPESNGPMVADPGPTAAKSSGPTEGQTVDYLYPKAKDRRWPTLGRILLKVADHIFKGNGDKRWTICCQKQTDDIKHSCHFRTSVNQGWLASY